jgi:hypothetical protein
VIDFAGPYAATEKQRGGKLGVFLDSSGLGAEGPAASVDRSDAANSDAEGHPSSSPVVPAPSGRPESSAKNALAASRSSTTMRTLSIRRIVMGHHRRPWDRERQAWGVRRLRPISSSALALAARSSHQETHPQITPISQIRTKNVRGAGIAFVFGASTPGEYAERATLGVRDWAEASTPGEYAERATVGVRDWATVPRPASTPSVPPFVPPWEAACRSSRRFNIS